MYEIDNKDRVVEIKNVPQSSVGAPNPLVIASESVVLLAYYLSDTPEGWDETTLRVVGLDTEDEPVALVQFDWCYTHMLGPPNDEALNGHPLYEPV